jgi:predicted kinase
MRRIARRLAAFHAGVDVAPAGASGAGAVTASVDENFTTLMPFADELGPGLLASSHRFGVAFVHGHRRLLEERATAGHVRDCHGDLRAEHVLVGDEVTVFDPLEFNPGLRLIDVAADLAFLVMDLHTAGAAGLADVLAAEYAAAGGDFGGDALLSFYAAYRAWVRVKVGCLRAAQLPPGPERDAQLGKARRLAAVARLLEWRARRPLVLVVCGRSATGKTLLARELSARSGLPVLSSDVVRKELAGLAATRRAPEREYTEAASLRVYRELGARAAAAAPGGGAVVDATFRRRAHRDAFADGYGAVRPPPLFLECAAPEAVLAERAAKRAQERDSVSDAGPAIVARQARELEPLDEVPPERHRLLRSDRPAGPVADSAEAWLDELLAAAERRSTAA